MLDETSWRSAGPDQQTIGFMPHRDGRVAYAVVGSGPPLLVDLGRAHDLEAFWRNPWYRGLIQRLGRRFTVVRWDRPGFGLSDRQSRDLTLEGELDLLDHLTFHLGLEQVRALAAGDAGPIMIQFAARRPAMVSRLALFGTAAAGRLLSLSLPAPALEALCVPQTEVIHALLAAATAGGCEPEVGRWLSSALGEAADAVTIVNLVAETTQLDARPVLPLVTAATLVLHREHDPAVPSAFGRELAAGIRGAQFAAVGGTAHLLFAGDPDPPLRVLMPFLAGGAEAELAAEPDRLSQRELEVVGMLLLGLTSAEIGQRMAIKRRTVEAHLEHIRAKLGVRTRSRIAAWAVANRLGGDGREWA